MSDGSKHAHIVLFFDGPADFAFERIAASLGARYPSLGAVATHSDPHAPLSTRRPGAPMGPVPFGPAGMLNIDGQIARIYDYHAPLSDEDLQACFFVSGPTWPDAQKALSKRSGQTSVRFPIPQIVGVSALALHTAAAAAATAIAAEIARACPNCLGAMWWDSGVLAPATGLVGAADGAMKMEWPLTFWLSFAPQSYQYDSGQAKGWRVRSRGLSFFVDQEVESVMAPVTFETAMKTAVGASQLLMKGAAFKDRDTIGVSGDAEKAVVRLGELDGGGHVYKIFHASSFYDPETGRLKDAYKDASG